MDEIFNSAKQQMDTYSQKFGSILPKHENATLGCWGCGFSCMGSCLGSCIGGCFASCIGFCNATCIGTCRYSCFGGAF